MFTTPRIVTVTVNPALDITTSTEVVRHTSKVRCGSVRHDPGGGGINVARVAHVLGARATAVCALGGHTGALLAELLEAEGVPYEAVRIAGLTRESLTVDETSTGRQYRFVLPGPALSEDEQQRLLRRLRTAADGAAVVVASGSLPPGVPADFYQRVAELCTETGARLVLDSSGGGLAHVHGAYLVKPSRRELAEYVGRDLATEADLRAAAHELIDRGVARVVVASLGGDGALLATAEGDRRFPAMAVHQVSAVGAGDAMVAGITVALVRDRPLDDAVRHGIAAASAMLLTPGTAPCRREDAERLYREIPAGEPLN
ncbi:1-phosphofructokinase family hexose kinase [uncultured Mycolicibacterium sp.]|uniref:1-phosphofructokinase family hexose kinase n=1 Tax=uncultured Mycolicibacterium sp. TaxID=2320817 RepID=UPI00260740CD|nr:1-phosphofructokinase family hexose kinase [uncultured Mycolicibacterium sp.]